MKVYELMEDLAKCNAGLDVKISMLKDLSEIPVWEGDLRQINFVVMKVEEDDDEVRLDGWTV